MKILLCALTLFYTTACADGDAQLDEDPSKAEYSHSLEETCNAVCLGIYACSGITDLPADSICVGICKSNQQCELELRSQVNRCIVPEMCYALSGSTFEPGTTDRNGVLQVADPLCRALGALTEEQTCMITNKTCDQCKMDLAGCTHDKTTCGMNFNDCTSDLSEVCDASNAS